MTDNHKEYIHSKTFNYSSPSCRITLIIPPYTTHSPSFCLFDADENIGGSGLEEILKIVKLRFELDTRKPILFGALFWGGVQLFQQKISVGRGSSFRKFRSLANFGSQVFLHLFRCSALHQPSSLLSFLSSLAICSSFSRVCIA